MKYWPKNKTGKYPFLDYFKGDYAVWLKKDSNFKQMMERYPEMMKELDEHRYEKLSQKLTSKTVGKIAHLLSTAIDEGNKFEHHARKGIEEMYPGVKVHNFDGLWDEAIEMSLDLVNSGEDFIAYEPYFQYNPVSKEDADALGIDVREFNFKTRVDVLVRVNGQFKVYEIKSSTSAKLDYAFDLFYQWKVLQKNRIEVEPANMFLVTIDNRYQHSNDYNIWTIWDGFLAKKPYKGKPENHNDVLDWYKKSISFEHRFANFIPELDRTINFPYIAKRIVEIQTKTIEQLRPEQFLNETVEVSFGKKSETKYRRGFRFFGDDFGGDYYEDLYLELLGLNEDKSIMELQTQALSFDWKIQLALRGTTKMNQLQPHQLLSYWDINNKLNGDREKAKEYAFKQYKAINDTLMPVGNKGLEQIFAEMTGKDLINTQELREFADKITYPAYFLRFDTTRIGILKYGDYRPFEEVLLGYTIGIVKNEEQLMSGEVTYVDFHLEEKSDLSGKVLDKLSEDLMVAGVGTWISSRYSMDKVILDRIVEEKWTEDIQVIKLVSDNLVNLEIPFKERHLYSKEFKGSSNLYALANKYAPEKDLTPYRKERMQNFGKRWIIDIHFDDLWKAVKPNLASISKEEVDVMIKAYKDIKTK